MRELALANQTVGQSGRGCILRGEEDVQHGEEQECAGIEDGERWTSANDFSHVLEAVMLKAAKESVRILSRIRTTGASGQKVDKTGKDGLLNAISLSSRKGWLINFRDLAFVLIVGSIVGVQTSEGGGRTQGRGMGRWLESERAPKKREGKRRVLAFSMGGKLKRGRRVRGRRRYQRNARQGSLKWGP
jgi:hypothetical protein